MCFTSDDESQNTFNFQPTPNTLELKKYKGINYVLSWKSKGIYTFKFTQLYTIFLNSTKISGYRTGIKCDNSILVVEQNNYTSKIVNFYIVFNLDTWPKNLLNNFILKCCLFGATNIVKINVEENFFIVALE